MKNKNMLYGNGQQVSEAMSAGLDVLQAMCDKYGLRLSCYVEQRSPSQPIVLVIYDGDFVLNQFNFRNEEDFLECISGQLKYLDYR